MNDLESTGGTGGTGVPGVTLGSKMSVENWEEKRLRLIEKERSLQPEKQPDARELAAAHRLEAVRALVKALNGDDSVRAAIALLDRSDGRAPVIDMSPKAWAERAAEMPEILTHMLTLCTEEQILLEWKRRKEARGAEQ